MGATRRTVRVAPRPRGPERDYGHSTSHTGGPFIYTSPDGERWMVYSVAFVNGKMLRTDTRHLAATHRVFVAKDGRQLFAAFTDIISRGSTDRVLFEQLAVAVPREAL
jgi:hypothetical protein